MAGIARQYRLGLFSFRRKTPFFLSKRNKISLSNIKVISKINNVIIKNKNYITMHKMIRINYINLINKTYLGCTVR